MGGLSKGEEASQAAVKRLVEDIEAFDKSIEIPIFFEQEVEKLDHLVFEEVGGGVRTGAGTTLTATLIYGNELFWAAVGDSRIYVIRDDEIAQVTRDHNYMLLLLEQVKRGLITYEDAKNHPKSGALISFIGSGSVKHININREPFKLVHGDIILLCSDGLTKSLSNDDIKEIVMDNYGDMKEAAHMLTLRAFDSGDGSKDNTSVILMQYFE
jgi:protein phosphatase